MTRMRALDLPHGGVEIYLEGQWRAIRHLNVDVGTVVVTAAGLPAPVAVYATAPVAVRQVSKR